MYGHVVLGADFLLVPSGFLGFRCSRASHECARHSRSPSKAMLLLHTCVGHTLPPRALRGAAHGAAYARPLDLGAAYARPLVLRAAQPPLLLLDEESGDINDGGISSVNWVTVDASGPDVEPTEEEVRGPWPAPRR